MGWGGGGGRILDGPPPFWVIPSPRFRYARRQHRRLQEEAEPTVTLEKVGAWGGGKGGETHPPSPFTTSPPPLMSPPNDVPPQVMAAVTEISVGLRDARGRLERLEQILGAGQPPRDPPPPHPETPPPPQDPHHPKGLVPP